MDELNFFVQIMQENFLLENFTLLAKNSSQVFTNLTSVRSVLLANVTEEVSSYVSIVNLSVLGQFRWRGVPAICTSHFFQ